MYPYVDWKCDPVASIMILTINGTTLLRSKSIKILKQIAPMS